MVMRRKEGKGSGGRGYKWNRGRGGFERDLIRDSQAFPAKS